MSSYLNIYGRLRSDLYEVKRLKNKDYYKQDDVILFDSHSRNSIIYSVVCDAINPVWAGDEEKYTVLNESNINDCIEECKKRITFLEKCVDNNIKRKNEYIKYLQSLSKVLTYDEYTNHITEEYDDYEDTKEEIENCKYCLSQLEVLASLISTCDIKCSGFSEILCNID
ncbi:hypothetical protein [Intestinibacter sp.]|uniref:hypothetical protein n=1 Tax=Intestinibacter sp. TaxID=1965304 RepID=UPI003F142284